VFVEERLEMKLELDNFVVSAPMPGLAEAIMNRCENRATRAVFYFAGTDWSRDPMSLARWSDVAHELTSA
jgi:hypothetical protein